MKNEYLKIEHVCKTFGQDEARSENEPSHQWLSPFAARLMPSSMRRGA